MLKKKYLDNSLSDAYRNKFVVLHLYGSHVSYRRRYPKKFDKFTAIPSGYENHPEDIQEKVNAYTNSILYSDFVVSRVIKTLSQKNKPTCMIYTSDHGEYLADNEGDSYTGHGYPVPHRVEVEVPLLVWCSKEYRELYPEKWRAILSNQSIKISNEDIFYSLADILKVDFPLMKTNHSFFSKDYVEQNIRKVRSAADGHIFNYRELK